MFLGCTWFSIRSKKLSTCAEPELKHTDLILLIIPPGEKPVLQGVFILFLICVLLFLLRFLKLLLMSERCNHPNLFRAFLKLSRFRFLSLSTLCVLEVQLSLYLLFFKYSNVAFVSCSLFTSCCSSNNKIIASYVYFVKLKRKISVKWLCLERVGNFYLSFSNFSKFLFNSVRCDKLLIFVHYSRFDYCFAWIRYRYLF